ncbi:hypothetical protein SAMD00019534_049250 [Acytostelium subglobosum LB1]|uniref:hypothetical protein n=1 Tax=Acytostelium subglobosum LB1 TaxID=1410327 RepID=UPI000644C998|nr:hypothetical protein SAMD00019534_049250 [Acytostelium subglobosum LB1]GAM21750.1 hypothetical protein SAMD00019534_049250 [Acytostelium subglobosum LB1]|eukprot:XP_012754850.1 hypothetical protein SAMD00019534_049250 [Acytostelium subglobosum LB1]
MEHKSLPPNWDKLLSRFLKSPDATLKIQPKERTQPFYQTVKEVVERMDHLTTLGRSAFDRHDFWYAVSYFTMALQCYDQHMNSSTLHNVSKVDLEQMSIRVAITSALISLTLTEVKCIPESITTANMTIEHDLNSILVYIQIANSLNSLGKNEQAIEQLKRGIDIAVTEDNKQMYDTAKTLLEANEKAMKLEDENKEYIQAKIAKDRTFTEFPIKMVWTGVGRHGGRKMVASKDIPKGTVILRVAPFASSLYDTMADSYCSACFQNITAARKTHVCTKCKNKICEMCQNDSITMEEHEVACKLLSVFPAREGDDILNSHVRITFLSVLRAVQNLEGKAHKQNTPAAWRKDGKPFIYDTLDDMQKISFREPVRMSKKESINYEKMATSIADFTKYLKGPKFMERLDINEFVKSVLRRIPPNVKELVDLYHQTPIGAGIYPSSALINHSCLSNTNSYMDNYGMLVYRSHQAIKVGEEITNSFIDPLFPMSYRRDKLLKDYNIYCECSRCVEIENTEHQCPKCCQALTKSHLQTWEPQPSIDFDGQVYVCSKGHATMAAIYLILEHFCEIELDLVLEPRYKVIIRKYFQPLGCVWLKYQREYTFMHMGKNSKNATELLKQLRQSYDTVFGDNGRLIIPTLYAEIYVAMLRLCLVNGNQREKVIIKKQFGQHLEETIQLSTHFAKGTFERFMP